MRTSRNALTSNKPPFLLGAFRTRRTHNEEMDHFDLSRLESKQNEAVPSRSLRWLFLYPNLTQSPALPWQLPHNKTCFLQNQTAICGISHVVACRKESVCCCCEKTACSQRSVCVCVRKGRLLGWSGDRQQTERQSAPAEAALLCSERAARTCSSADYAWLARSRSIPPAPHTFPDTVCTLTLLPFASKSTNSSTY